MRLPCLHVAYTGDHCLFPGDADLPARRSPPTTSARVEIDANHYGFPVKEGRNLAIETIAGWLWTH